MTFQVNPQLPLSGNDEQQRLVDNYWMQHALNLAAKAEERGEVPVGAVVVHENKLIGEGYNQSIQQSDPTAHAEIVALRQAALQQLNYRLINTTLYVTLEPCAMCAGALIHARVHRLVYATPDPKSGAVESIFSLLNQRQLNHQVITYHGILQQEASLLLKNFFKKKRIK